MPPRSRRLAYVSWKGSWGTGSLGLIRVTGAGPARPLPGRTEGLVSSLQVASLKLEGAISLTVAGLKSRRPFPCRLSQACLCRQGFVPASFSPASLLQPQLRPLCTCGLPSSPLVVLCSGVCGGRGSMPTAGLHRLLQQETCACLLLQFPQAPITATLLKGMKWAFAFHHQHCALIQEGTDAAGMQPRRISSFSHSAGTNSFRGSVDNTRSTGKL